MMKWGIGSSILCAALAAAICDGQGFTIHTVTGNGVGGYSGDNLPATAAEIWGPLRYGRGCSRQHLYRGHE